MAYNDYSINVRTSLSYIYRFIFFILSHWRCANTLKKKTTFNSWTISEASSLIITIPNQFYKTGPNKFSMSIRNNQNNIIAIN